MSGANIFPTYIPELDHKILEEIDDANLFRSCNTNSYIANICNDETFWRNRTKARYAKLIRFRPPATTWKSFYTRLINDAMYIVEISWDHVYLYSDINRAYNMLWSKVASSHQITLEEALITKFERNDIDIATIKLLYKNEVIANDNKYILYDFINREIDILQYPNLPGLAVKNMDLFYYSGLRFKTELINGYNMGEYDDSANNEFMGVFDYTIDVLASFINYVPSYKVDYLHNYVNNYHILSIDTDNMGTKLNSFAYGYRSITYQDLETGEYYQNLLVNEKLFGKPLMFRQFRIPINGPNVSHPIIVMMEEAIRNYYNEH